MAHAIVYRRFAAYLLLAGALAYGAVRIWRDPAVLTCPWFAWTGMSCPLCGGQRALHALLHGAWFEAWRYNPLLVTLAAVMAPAAVLTGAGFRVPRGRACTAGTVLLVAAMLFGLGRNLN